MLRNHGNSTLDTPRQHSGKVVKGDKTSCVFEDLPVPNLDIDPPLEPRCLTGTHVELKQDAALRSHLGGFVGGGVNYIPYGASLEGGAAIFAKLGLHRVEFLQSQRTPKSTESVYGAVFSGTYHSLDDFEASSALLAREFVRNLALVEHFATLASLGAKMHSVGHPSLVHNAQPFSPALPVVLITLSRLA
ncbi:hypothetical protein GGX14DRAFT_558639 [Mycena pura]|uniref:Uncharacterized protein n=1 Tax=Mycena pura TaxID=153505 RepID=A0AAD6YL85_9AGAR|nr:hypothetical protein GGX14DRAFT_558639 [Mycena pura]